MALSCQEPDRGLKSQEHLAADQELKLQREKYQQHQLQLKERMEKLEIRRRNLEEKRARYNKHIQDGKERCKAAHRRAKLELEIVSQKETEIEALEEELKAVKEGLQSRQKYSQKLIGYQEFLQAAVDKSDGEFETMEDLLSRYYILKQTKKDLQYQIEKILESISTSRSMTAQLQQSHSNELLNSGNKMTKLRENILENQEKISQLEDRLERLRKDRRDKILEEGTLKLATNNIYHILLQYRNRAGLPKPRQGIVPDDELEQQLIKIAEYINDLKTVTEEVDEDGASDKDSNSINVVRGSKPPLLV